MRAIGYRTAAWSLPSAAMWVCWPDKARNWQQNLSGNRPAIRRGRDEEPVGELTGRNHEGREHKRRCVRASTQLDHKPGGDRGDNARNVSYKIINAHRQADLIRRSAAL